MVVHLCTVLRTPVPCMCVALLSIQPSESIHQPRGEGDLQRRRSSGGGVLGNQRYIQYIHYEVPQAINYHWIGYQSPPPPTIDQTNQPPRGWARQGLFALDTAEKKHSSGKQPQTRGKLTNTWNGMKRAITECSQAPSLPPHSTFSPSVVCVCEILGCASIATYFLGSSHFCPHPPSPPPPNPTNVARLNKHVGPFFPMPAPPPPPSPVQSSPGTCY